MTKQVEAVYENGLLRPLEPVPLEEHQHVTVVISEVRTVPERSHPDSDYLIAVRAEVAAMSRIPTLDEIHKVTAKDPSSGAAAVNAEREERF
ncbi:MAG: antitoxin family protein [Bryobacteraceae bacterium]|jgi:predicted DNA-binding antitoxin AbrB/MazE fold protein